MAITLLDLAPELLLGVARQIERERDLNALIQTCRRLYTLLGRELYRQNVQLHGSSALLWAAKRGQVTTVQKLLLEGADVCGPRVEADGYSQLRTDSPISEIQDRWAEVNRPENFRTDLRYCGFTPLMLSIFYRCDSTARILIENGADVNERYPFLYHKCTPLHMAAKAASVTMIRLLLQRGAEIEALDMIHQTPLHYAVKTSGKRRGERSATWARAVGVLLRNNANVEARDRTGRTPRRMAMYCPDQLVRLLLCEAPEAQVALDELDTGD